MVFDIPCIHNRFVSQINDDDDDDDDDDVRNKVTNQSLQLEEKAEPKQTGKSIFRGGRGICKQWPASSAPTPLLLTQF